MMEFGWIALAFCVAMSVGGSFVVIKSQSILSKRVFVLEKLALGDHKEAFPEWCHRAAEEDGKGPYVDDRAWPDGKGRSGSVYRDPAVVESETFEGFVLIRVDKKGIRSVGSSVMTLEKAFVMRASMMANKDQAPSLYKGNPDYVVHSAVLTVGKPTKPGAA